MTSINMALTRVMLAVSGLKARLAEDRGQDLLEYALLGGLLAAALVGIAVLLNTALDDMVAGIADCIDFDGVADCGPFLG